MKMVVVGGTGFIGTKLVNKTSKARTRTTRRSTQHGVNPVTRDGLARALEGTSVVVDVSNCPDWNDAALLHRARNTVLRLPQFFDFLKQFIYTKMFRKSSFYDDVH